MGCQETREALSARLDGEQDPAEYAVVEQHLVGCADCRGWLDNAAAVTRLARTSVITSAAGDTESWAGVDDAVLDALPRPRRRLALVLRTLLGLLGAGQFILGVAQIAGIAAVEHTHPELGGASPNHLLNESAAWNVAVGAGFAWIALRRSRPAGLLPTLTAFVLVLTLLSASDVAAGRVEPVRLLSHGLLIAGYLIVLALNRPALDPGEPPAARGDGSSKWRLGLELDATAPPLRLVRPRVGPDPATAKVSDRPAA